MEENKSKTIAIVGFAPPSRALAPWEDIDITIAGLNEEYKFDWFKRKEGNVVWFQLHPRESFTRENNTNDPNHWKWLQKEHPFPIIMQERYEDVPSSVRYPREKVFKEFGTYFTSSLTYIMAWAYLEGYTRMELYGFNMASNTEYIIQRPNTHYFIGLLRGKGIDIYTHPESKLMQGYAEYAYDDLMLGFRQDLEMVRAINNPKMEEAVKQTNFLRGKANALMDAAQIYPELAPKYEEVEKAAVMARDNFNIKKGWLRGILSAESMVDRMIGFQRLPEDKNA